MIDTNLESFARRDPFIHNGWVISRRCTILSSDELSWTEVDPGTLVAKGNLNNSMNLNFSISEIIITGNHRGDSLFRQILYVSANLTTKTLLCYDNISNELYKSWKNIKTRIGSSKSMLNRSKWIWIEFSYQSRPLAQTIDRSSKSLNGANCLAKCFSFLFLIIVHFYIFDYFHCLLYLLDIFIWCLNYNFVVYIHWMLRIFFRKNSTMENPCLEKIMKRKYGNEKRICQCCYQCVCRSV